MQSEVLGSNGAFGVDSETQKTPACYLQVLALALLECQRDCVLGYMQLVWEGQSFPELRPIQQEPPIVGRGTSS